jgi:hypothetical protein
MDLCSSNLCDTASSLPVMSPLSVRLHHCHGGNHKKCKLHLSLLEWMSHAMGHNVVTATLKQAVASPTPLIAGMWAGLKGCKGKTVKQVAHQVCELPIYHWWAYSYNQAAQQGHMGVHAICLHHLWLPQSQPTSSLVHTFYHITSALWRWTTFFNGRQLYSMISVLNGCWPFHCQADKGSSNVQMMRLWVHSSGIPRTCHVNHRKLNITR